MSRASRRALKKTFQKDIVEFLKIQAHFLPDFIKDLGEFNDPRKWEFAETGRKRWKIENEGFKRKMFTFQSG